MYLIETRESSPGLCKQRLCCGCSKFGRSASLLAPVKVKPHVLELIFEDIDGREIHTYLYASEVCVFGYCFVTPAWAPSAY